MKKIGFLLFISMVLYNCEEVIDIDDLPSGPSRLVIDALIRIPPDVIYMDVRIKASLSNSFFDSIIPAEQVLIKIQNIDKENNNTLILTTSGTEPGVYEANVRTDFFKEGRIVLEVQYNNEYYVAITQFVPSPPIDQLEQGDSSLFNPDETEIIVTFTDIPERDDYYLLDFDFNQYLVTEDLFYKDQSFSFSYFYDEKLKPNKTVHIKILGVDFGFYNYMNQIIAQSGETQGPFQTPAGTVRGNIINVTGTDYETIASLENMVPNENYALGYFALCETHEKSITIK